MMLRDVLMVPVVGWLLCEDDHDKKHPAKSSQQSPGQGTTAGMRHVLFTSKYAMADRRQASADLTTRPKPVREDAYEKCDWN
jgi:hypothetical protein